MSLLIVSYRLHVLCVLLSLSRFPLSHGISRFAPPASDQMDNQCSGIEASSKGTVYYSAVGVSRVSSSPRDAWLSINRSARVADTLYNNSSSSPRNVLIIRAVASFSLYRILDHELTYQQDYESLCKKQRVHIIAQWANAKCVAKIKRTKIQAMALFRYLRPVDKALAIDPHGTFLCHKPCRDADEKARPAPFIYRWGEGPSSRVRQHQDRYGCHFRAGMEYSIDSASAKFKIFLMTSQAFHEILQK